MTEIKSNRKQQMSAYNKSPAGRERTRRYRESKKFQEVNERYKSVRKARKHESNRMERVKTAIIKDFEAGQQNYFLMDKYKITYQQVLKLREKWEDEYGKRSPDS